MYRQMCSLYVGVHVCVWSNKKDGPWSLSDKRRPAVSFSFCGTSSDGLNLVSPRWTIATVRTHQRERTCDSHILKVIAALRQTDWRRRVPERPPLLPLHPTGSLGSRNQTLRTTNQQILREIFVKLCVLFTVTFTIITHFYCSKLYVFDDSVKKCTINILDCKM